MASKELINTFKEIEVIALMLGFGTDNSEGANGLDLECTHPGSTTSYAYTIFMEKQDYRTAEIHIRIETNYTSKCTWFNLPLTYSNHERLITHARLSLIKINKELNNV